MNLTKDSALQPKDKYKINKHELLIKYIVFI